MLIGERSIKGQMITMDHATIAGRVHEGTVQPFEHDVPKHSELVSFFRITCARIVTLHTVTCWIAQ